MKNLKKNVLKNIMPSKDEEKKLKDMAKEILKKLKVKDAKTELGGSVAKETWLKGNHDIDIYVKFDPKKNTNKNIAEILKKKLQKIKGIKSVHGSRDYFQIEKKMYTIEIIPILDIKNVKQAKNITDVSPFHVKWVKQHKQLNNDMRLMKAFCKANKIYGAESYIKGFSGYVLEILTAHYGSFDKTIKAISKWKEKTIIDVENHFKNKNIINELNSSKTLSPLILIDPVQKERNAAAGLSKERYEQLKKLAKVFLKNSSEDFFIKKEITITELKKRTKGKELILLEATPLKGKQDVIGAKMIKAFEYMAKHLNLNEFKVIEKGWEWNKKALFYFILEKKPLSKLKKHYGPPKKAIERLNQFKKKWKGKTIHYEKNKSYVKIERQFRTPKTFLKYFIQKSFIKNKIKKIELL